MYSLKLIIDGVATNPIQNCSEYQDVWLFDFKANILVNKLPFTFFYILCTTSENQTLSVKPLDQTLDPRRND